MAKSKNKKSGAGGSDTNKSSSDANEGKKLEKEDSSSTNNNKDNDESKASSSVNGSDPASESQAEKSAKEKKDTKKNSPSGTTAAAADSNNAEKDDTKATTKNDSASNKDGAIKKEKEEDDNNSTSPMTTSKDKEEGSSKNNNNKTNNSDDAKTKDEKNAGSAASAAAETKNNDEGNVTNDEQLKPHNNNPQSANTHPSRASSTTQANATNPSNENPAAALTRPSQTASANNPPSSTNTTTTTNNIMDTTNNNDDDDDFDNDYTDSKDTLLAMNFNQDGGCLAVGTGSGFRICNAHPFQETFRRNLGVDGDAGIAHIEMLYRTNLLALTGHSSSPHYPPNKVLIYDDHLQRTIGELSFRQKVLTTKLRRDRIVVVLRDRVYIYNFSDLALLDKVHTGDNPLGLIGISMDNGGVGGSTVERAEDALGGGSSSTSQQRNNGMVLACPGTQRGQVRVELYGLRRTTTVVAHESALGALALSVDGSLLATASERGTVIRLFDTRGVTLGGGDVSGSMSGSARQETTSSVSSSVPLREFRRGVERATITCLTFSLDSNWLGCASNHGTVHIFQTHDPHNNSNGENAKKKKSTSMTGKAMRMLPKLVTAPKKYLMDGEQSFAQVRGIPHPRACAFVPDRERTIAVAGVDEYGNGCLLLAEFGSKSVGSGGAKGIESSSGNKADHDSSEARRLGYHRFFKCKSPGSQCGNRRTPKGHKDGKHAADAAPEGGAYIDDAPVDMRMNHISIGDENEDDFVPIDYNNDEEKK